MPDRPRLANAAIIPDSDGRDAIDEKLSALLNRSYILTSALKKPGSLVVAAAVLRFIQHNNIEKLSVAGSASGWQDGSQFALAMVREVLLLSC